MRKLFKLAPLNARENIFILPEGACVAIFDRDVMLETDRYLIDPLDGSVKLKMRPFGKVRALVDVGAAKSSASGRPDEIQHPDRLSQLISDAVETGADRAIRRAMMTRDRGKP